MTELGEIWVYLAAAPLLWLTLTLVVYLAGRWLNRKLNGNALAHPVLVAMFVLIGLLLLTGTPYDTYFEGAQFIHFLLGPATVALAIPLYDNLRQIRQLLLPLLLACLVGVTVAVSSAVGLAWLLGATGQSLLSIAPKSVTTPIAMGIAEQVGGLPSLAAGIVLVTGAVGVVAAGPLFRLARIHDHRAQGFALGIAAHGFGTAHALTIGLRAGAFAGLGLGMAGLLTAFLLPVVLRLFAG
ncbi:MAG TPA: LrgB family protein [Gammaproteobacteria bacterium]|nr:LrgB family protein [Gammaproteobacteria bacterium]